MSVDLLCVCPMTQSEAAGLLTIDDLIEIGIAAAVQGSQVQRHYCVTTRPLVAFLCYSSGTSKQPPTFSTVTILF